MNIFGLNNVTIEAETLNNNNYNFNIEIGNEKYYFNTLTKTGKPDILELISGNNTKKDILNNQYESIDKKKS